MLGEKLHEVLCKFSFPLQQNVTPLVLINVNAYKENKLMKYTSYIVGSVLFCVLCHQVQE